MNFSWLRDFITESNTEVVGSFLTPDEIKRFTHIFWNLGLISEGLSKMLIRPEKTLNTLDIDDTISDRTKSLMLSKFSDNRWETGNELIEREYGFERFVEKFYEPGDVVSELVQILLSRDDYREPFILSAWRDKFQNLKAQRFWIQDQPKSIVESQWLKPVELLRYIIDSLWYIPGKIIIYEDRPECFKETWVFLTKLLWCEIVVNHVTLSWTKLNTIDNIKQIIYKR